MKNISPSKIRLKSLPKMKWRASGPMFIGVKGGGSSSKTPAMRAETITAAPHPARNGKPVCYNSPIVNVLMEKPMQKFQAGYEDMALSEAEARKRGWDGSEGMLDHLNDNGVRVYRQFATKAEAEKWLKDEIAALKTVFGCGDIDVLEQPKRRCDYCTCGGWLTVASFIVDDEGISDERSLSEECAWD